MKDRIDPENHRHLRGGSLLLKPFFVNRTFCRAGILRKMPALLICRDPKGTPGREPSGQRRLLREYRRTGRQAVPLITYKQIEF